MFTSQTERSGTRQMFPDEQQAAKDWTVYRASVFPTEPPQDLGNGNVWALGGRVQLG